MSQDTMAWSGDKNEPDWRICHAFIVWSGYQFLGDAVGHAARLRAADPGSWTTFLAAVRVGGVAQDVAGNEIYLRAYDIAQGWEKP